MLVGMDPAPSLEHPLDLPGEYRILIRGTLDASWAERLEGLTVSVARLADETPITLLSGILTDQSALLGVLNALHDLGLPLMSVERVDAAASPLLDQS